MGRALILASLALAIPLRGALQEPRVLHISVALVDRQQNTKPLRGHALLISDDPPTTAPRRVVTSVDGAADVRLRPGNYIVESDRPVAFEGRAYHWIQMVSIAADRDARLELTADNAEIEPVTSEAVTLGAAAAEPLESDPSSLMGQWQDSVVELWTPIRRASGLLIGPSGLIVTNTRAIGSETSVDVQLAPTVKVRASILTSDTARDVAVLWIDPNSVASTKVAPLRCAQAAEPPVVTGQELYAIESPLRKPKEMAFGSVTGVEAGAIESDVLVASGSAGGPVFTAAGDLVGITSEDDGDQRSRGARIIRTNSLCAVLASTEKEMNSAAPPNGTRLPVEPLQPYPLESLKAAAEGRAGSLNPYQVSSANFDIAFITPVLTYGAHHLAEQMRAAGRNTGAGSGAGPTLVRPVMEFGNWSEYVEDYPPVLLVRATPKLVEGFWMKVARGAAHLQGMSLPAFKHFSSSFLRMRTFCGDDEVAPIHPFKLEQPISETEAIYEGLYVFDPGALGPHCASVKLVLYSEKNPEKAETQGVDAKVISQIWRDFALYRALK
jgi:S1-C subfamily serine protease